MERYSVGVGVRASPEENVSRRTMEYVLSTVSFAGPILPAQAQLHGAVQSRHGDAGNCTRREGKVYRAPRLYFLYVYQIFVGTL